MEMLLSMDRQTLFILLNAVLFLCICMTVYFTNAFFTDKERLINMLNNTYEQLGLGEEVASLDLGGKPGQQGEKLKKTFTEKVDDMLVYSGLQLKFPFLNVKTAYFILGFSAFLVFGITDIFTGQIMWGGSAAAALILIVYLVLYMMRTRNYSNTEKDITLFMNMVTNFSSTSDDIIFILERTSSYLNNPLKNAIQIICTSAKSDGNITLALQDLRRKIEHPLFKRIVSNLELCSRNSCDYRNIIEDSRERVEASLSSATKRRAIYSAGRINIFMLIGVGIFLIWESMSFVGDDKTFLEVMTQNIIGKIILVFVVLSFGFSLYYAIFKLQEK